MKTKNKIMISTCSIMFILCLCGCDFKPKNYDVNKGSWKRYEEGTVASTSIGLHRGIRTFHIFFTNDHHFCSNGKFLNFDSIKKGDVGAIYLWTKDMSPCDWAKDFTWVSDNALQIENKNSKEEYFINYFNEE